MRSLTEEQIQGFGVAINEASFVSLRVNPSSAETLVTLQVMSWDETADVPAYPTVDVVLSPTGRISAALRYSRWDDRDAAAEPLNLDGLIEAIDGLGSTPLYGWDYIDRVVTDWDFWQDRLSFDETIFDASTPHYIHLFKESYAPEQILDLRVWFKDLHIQTSLGQVIELEEFIRLGVRWWDAMYAGDQRTSSTGIVALAAAEADPPPPNRLERSRRWFQQWTKRR